MLCKALVSNVVSEGGLDKCDLLLVDSALGELPVLHNVSSDDLRKFLKDAVTPVETNFELNGKSISVGAGDKPSLSDGEIEKLCVELGEFIDYKCSDIGGSHFDEIYESSNLAFPTINEIRDKLVSAGVLSLFEFEEWMVGAKGEPCYQNYYHNIYPSLWGWIERRREVRGTDQDDLKTVGDVVIYGFVPIQVPVDTVKFALKDEGSVFGAADFLVALEEDVGERDFESLFQGCDNRALWSYLFRHSSEANLEEEIRDALICALDTRKDLVIKITPCYEGDGLLGYDYELPIPGFIVE
jgi:hypothetical protein